MRFLSEWMKELGGSVHIPIHMALLIGPMIFYLKDAPEPHIKYVMAGIGTCLFFIGISIICSFILDIKKDLT